MYQVAETMAEYVQFFVYSLFCSFYTQNKPKVGVVWGKQTMRREGAYPLSTRF